jgi:hypothetical protein
MSNIRFDPVSPTYGFSALLNGRSDLRVKACHGA